MPDRPALLFVTGAPRTGTTLLQKLLDMQPGVSVLAQPLPLLFVEVKRSFLASLGSTDEKEPLGHLFGESRYRPADFDAYLRTKRVTAARLQEVVDSMHGYSGQYDRLEPTATAATIAALGDGASFVDILRAVYTGHASKPGARVVGAKEAFCEEFLPFLRYAGFHTVLILRDPRDAIASMRYGDSAPHAGSRRPLLTDVRRWRKSVAFALELAGTERFTSLRYEDLARDPATVLDVVGQRLGTSVAYTPGAPVVTATGTRWPGNSSFVAFDAVTADSVGTHGPRMPAAEVRFIAAMCAPEMRALGYAAGDVPDLESAFVNFREEASAVRPGYESDLLSARSLAAESERLRLLQDPDAADKDRYFLSERSRLALAASL